MKYIPILYNNPMVQALLDKRKTKTRRLLNPQPNNDIWIEKSDSSWGYVQKKQIGSNPDRFEIIQNWKCPYGQIGDVLWVRENYKLYINFDNQVYVQFEGRETFDVYNKKEISLNTLQKIVARKLKPNEWHSCPSIHLYKEFASIFLKITDISVERLQNITEDDAIAEGVQLVSELNDNKKYLDYTGNWDYLSDAKDSFISLWQSINGPDSWEANPWVWVIQFEQIAKPIDFK